MAGRDMEIWREAGAVLAVFLLLGAALWTLRQRGGIVRAGGSKSLRAIERIVLTPHHSVHLIRVRDRELLLATHPQGCSLLFEQTCEPGAESVRVGMPVQSAAQRISDTGKPQEGAETA